MTKKDTFYSDGDGGTSANGTVECDEDGNIIGMPELVGEEAFVNWREQGKKIVVEECDRQWALGEWIVGGEEMKEAAGITIDQRFKNAVYKSAADITGHSVKTIKSLAFVVRNVPVELKQEFKVSFAHLKLVASCDLHQQRELLDEMQRANLTVAEGRRKVQFRTGKLPGRKTVADRRAERILWHCTRLLEHIQNHPIDAETISPKLYGKVAAAALDAQKALEVLIEEPALVSNLR